ncbi:MAG TPA: HRDC domain-containing protein [Gordonia sp. (in: high G+C Gram-positive bacteria)]|uniref:HRDC domain-containing protein n=1 Tax=unclassified Gordonia (in: high G+C Gram-positive bacteria) TaxID=2657482 RepID=UPI000F9F6CB7|nr:MULTISPECIES: HRDC domain-containing protein [unclassified Gordonia (in: high G+C Gram-positive bacteria)]RUP41349.1 MAG: ribonuclease D [Gordonia sp. (in: high G+C Gram-positive bacteria)]HNP58132.1 HRDC domain-containing protein [Gordonia sp. (in: high G+C Gram-positive bacteria)]HRC50467.1 HRDC domain-containing protein [Gordonia sp. (in: high G+C Gram-positive bacteria)]
MCPASDPTEPPPDGTAPDADSSGVDAQPAPEPLLAPADGVPAVLVEPDGFAEAAARLRSGTGPIALDTERASGFRYSQRAYLIQIRRAGAGTFLIDPIAHPDGLSEVIAALNGPEWVLHAADQDLPCLRELGFSCATLFDTELAGRLLGMTRVNLAAMTAQFLGRELLKGHGAADWSKRPLPHDWLNYAALDVELLVELRDAMDAELREHGKDDWAAQEFAYVLARPPAPPRPDRWRRLSHIHSLRTPAELAAARELWHAREDLAQARDVAPGRVLPDAAIIDAARANPTTVDELTKLKIFGGPRQRRHARRWLAALHRAQALPTGELPPRTAPTTGLPPINRWDQRNPEAAARAAAVRPAIAQIAESVSVPAENLLSPEVVRQLCWQGVAATPDAVDDALQSGAARRWQRDLTRDAIAQALREI